MEATNFFSPKHALISLCIQVVLFLLILGVASLVKFDLTQLPLLLKMGILPLMVMLSIAIFIFGMIAGGCSLVKTLAPPARILIISVVHGVIVCILTYGSAKALTVPVQIDRVELRESGQYQMCDEANMESDTLLFANRDTIPAVLGNRFGGRVRIKRFPERGALELKHVWIYPPSRTNDSLAAAGKKDEYYDKGYLGRSISFRFSFDKKEELLPGTGTYQLWRADEKIFEKSFVIVPAR